MVKDCMIDLIFDNENRCSDEEIIFAFQKAMISTLTERKIFDIKQYEKAMGLLEKKRSVFL